MECKKCKSKNLISDEEILTFCGDCGYIQDQKNAKKDHDAEVEEWSHTGGVEQ